MNSPNPPELVLCIVPGQDKNVYSSIKKVCCIEYGVPSQVVTSKIIDRNKPKTLSVITKIGYQMNCKLGGQIWGVKIPVCKKFLSLSTRLIKIIKNVYLKQGW